MGRSPARLHEVKHKMKRVGKETTSNSDIKEKWASSQGEIGQDDKSTLRTQSHRVTVTVTMAGEGRHQPMT